MLRWWELVLEKDRSSSLFNKLVRGCALLWKLLEEVGGPEVVWWCAGGSGAKRTQRLSPADTAPMFRSNFVLVDLAAHNARWLGVLLLQFGGLKMSFFRRCSGDGFGFVLVERLKKMVLVLCFFLYLLLCACLFCIFSLL